MSKFAPTRTSYLTTDNRWNRDGIQAKAHGVSLTTAAFRVADIGADGLVKSGAFVAGQGHLKDDLVIKAGETHLVAVVHDTTVDRRFLPGVALTKAQETSLSGITYINGVVPS